MPPYNLNRPDVNNADPYQNVNYNYEHGALSCDNTSYECSPPIALPAVVGHRIWRQRVPLVDVSPSEASGKTIHLSQEAQFRSFPSRA
jgi:hypothetical protein